jgi:zinc protease
MAEPSFEQSALDRNLQALKIMLRQEQQSPSKVASKAFFKAMYADHPYAHPSSGTEQSIDLLKREALERFHRQYYVGSNAIIAIVGAVDREQAATLVEKVIGKLPAGEHAAELPAVDLEQSLLRQEIQFPSKQAHLYIGLPVLSRGDPDYFPLYVGNHVLGGSGLVSRISVEVREKRGLAYSSYSYFSPMRGPGPFIMGLQTKNSQAMQAESVVLQTLKDYLKQGPTEEELHRAKQNITGGFPLQLASNKKIVEYLSMIGFYQLPMNYLDTFVDNINAVTAGQIIEAFNRRVITDRLSTIVVGQVTEP